MRLRDLEVSDSVIAFPALVRFIVQLGHWSSAAFELRGKGISSVQGALWPSPVFICLAATL